jgi:hypothetical protein
VNEAEFGADEFGEQPPAGAEPKWYRERMDKVSEQMRSMKDELEAMRAERTHRLVAEKLTAAGFAPGAAALFTGDPEKVDDWLTANGGFLAREGAPGAEAQQQGTQVPAGPPPTTVSPQDQAALTQMQQASGTVPSGGTNTELQAQLLQCKTEAELSAFLAQHGNGMTA